jgi:predicted enzyme related to lactoylglutathione lyase
MTTQLAHLRFDANDPLRLARFWASSLGWEIDEEANGEIRVLPTDGTPFAFSFFQVSEPKTSKNPIHLDLVSDSVDHQQEIVERLTALGAERVDIGQGPDAEHIVLADPEGNEFCIVIRGEFLADTGFIGAVVFEPANPVTGYFWGEAIGWPVVYDQDGDVAIRAPDGRGPFFTFGPPRVVESEKNRLHLDLLAHDQATEVDRLIALGATRIDRGRDQGPRAEVADPDGNEFFVLSRQN